MSVFQDLLDLVLPTKCALCLAQGSPVCACCYQQLVFDPREFDRAGIIGLAASEYGPKERQLLKSFKEQGQTSLARFIAEPMVPLFLEALAGFECPVLVPMPSSKENFISRGFKPAKVLANRVRRDADQIRPSRDTGRKVEISEALRFNRVVADQSHLDYKGRMENLRGSMTSKASLEGRHVWLFDDVVTTGSTLIEGARAIREVGGEVVGILVFAETILKTQTKS